MILLPSLPLFTCSCLSFFSPSTSETCELCESQRLIFSLPCSLKSHCSLFLLDVPFKLTWYAGASLPSLPNLSSAPTSPSLISQDGLEFTVQPPLLSGLEACSGRFVLTYKRKKERKKREGGGLIQARARRLICLLSLCLSHPSHGSPSLSSIICGGGRGYWVKMHGELWGPWHRCNPPFFLSCLPAVFLYIITFFSHFLPFCMSLIFLTFSLWKKKNLSFGGQKMTFGAKYTLKTWFLTIFFLLGSSAGFVGIYLASLTWSFSL